MIEGPAGVRHGEQRRRVYAERIWKSNGHRPEGDVRQHRTGNGECRRRAFGGDRKPELLAEILGDANAGRAAPDIARHVIVIDRRRLQGRVGPDADGVHRRKRPHLAKREMKAVIVLVDVGVELAHAEIIGIALVRIRRLARAEKVGFEIALYVRRRIEIAAHEQGGARRAGAEVELACLAGRHEAIGNGVVGRRDVSPEPVAAPDGFEGEEAARNDLHSLVDESVGEGSGAGLLKRDRGAACRLRRRGRFRLSFRA